MSPGSSQDPALAVHPWPLAFVELAGPEFRICDANEAFLRLLGSRPDNVIGRTWAEVAGDRCGGDVGMERAVALGASSAPEAADLKRGCWLRAIWPTAPGSTREAEIVIRVVPPRSPDLAAFNAALLASGLREQERRELAEQANRLLQAEIEERRRAEAALKGVQDLLQVHAVKLEQTIAERTAELQASLGELEILAYSLAHDLRAPVRAIHGFTQAALELGPGSVSPAAAALLSRVVAAASRMDDLIQDVLSLSQVIRRPVTVSPVDLDALLGVLIGERPELSAPPARIQVEGPLLRVAGHEALLAQCLTNLLDNAMKFVRPGEPPDVRVWTQPVAGPFPAAGGAAPPWVRIWVEDHGIGIAPEQQGRIFEMFHRLNPRDRYEGTGIGLTIVRKAIERMGGRVGVESIPGQGSRFWLELPAA